MKNRFKVLIVSMLLLLTTTFTVAQENLSISIAQDVNLAFFEDDNGISPWTTDITIRARLNGYQKDIGYLTYGVHFEYADLADEWYGDYYRYGFEVGYTFNNFEVFDIPFNVTPVIAIGGIDRQNKRNAGCFTYNFGTEVAIPITDWLNGYSSVGYQWRGDLPDSELQSYGNVGMELLIGL